MRARPSKPYPTLVLAACAAVALALGGVPLARCQEAAPVADPNRWAALARERLPMLEVCRPEGAQEDMLCGTLEVWEDREAPHEDGAGRKIGLNVVVVPAHTEDPEPDPFTFVAGGPGEGIAGGAGFVPLFAADVLAQRDVFLLDQRGTGKSNGLFCAFGITPQDPQPAYDAMFPLEGVVACKKELEKKADLTRYTTTIAAHDMEEVRKWLGYGPINLYGGSYGTRFVQEYMRRYPGSVRAALMLGVVSMDHRMPLNHALDGQRSLDMLIARCEADEACDGAFPRLRDELWEVLARLDREPGRATIENPLAEGEEVTLEVRRGVFAESLRSLLYLPEGAAELPFIVHRAFEGDLAPFFKTTLPWRVFIELELANGLYLSVTCGEDTSWYTEEEAALHNAGTATGDFRTDAQSAACEVWPVAQIPDDFHDPVVSDRPALILAGELDPVTPPRYGREAAEHMSNSLFVLVPRGHHGFDGLSHPECIEGIASEFLETASPEGIDTSCVREMASPPFVVEESGMRYMRPGGMDDAPPGVPGEPEPPGADG